MRFFVLLVLLFVYLHAWVGGYSGVQIYLGGSNYLQNSP